MSRKNRWFTTQIATQTTMPNPHNNPFDSLSCPRATFAGTLMGLCWEYRHSLVRRRRQSDGSSSFPDDRHVQPVGGCTSQCRLGECGTRGASTRPVRRARACVISTPTRSLDVIARSGSLILLKRVMGQVCQTTGQVQPPSGAARTWAKLLCVRPVSAGAVVRENIRSLYEV